MSKWLRLQCLFSLITTLPTLTSLCALCSWERHEISWALCSLGSITWGAICRIVGSHMPPLSQEHKHQTLVQLRSGFFYSQSCHFSKLGPILCDVYEEWCKGQDWGTRRRTFQTSCILREEALCHYCYYRSTWNYIYATTKQLWFETNRMSFDTVVRRTLREARLGAQVHQRKPFMSCEHVLTCSRFAQRYENWIIDDWKHVVFCDETKIKRVDLDYRS